MLGGHIGHWQMNVLGHGQVGSPRVTPTCHFVQDKGNAGM